MRYLDSVNLFHVIASRITGVVVEDIIATHGIVTSCTVTLLITGIR